MLAAAVTNSDRPTNTNGAPIPTSEEVDQAIANGDIRNIPLNALYALANVPYNETTALNQLAASLLYTGNWLTPSGTNVWGEDAADPGHFESIVNVFNPYPAMSDIMGYQTAMLAAALLPADQSCDAEGCAPLTPVTPITGITGIDRALWSMSIVAGTTKLPLVNNWINPDTWKSLVVDHEFTFDPADYENVSDGINEDGSVPTHSFTDSMGNTFTFEGTKVVNGENVMPWAGNTFDWDPALGWKNFYASLVSTPPTDGAYGTGINVATPQDTIYAYQALLAGLVVDFNPFIPGSPACPGQCEPDSVLGFTTPAIVKMISDMYPGNPMLEEYLNQVDAGTANGPTPEQLDTAIRIMQTGYFTFDQETTERFYDGLEAINPQLRDVFADLGIVTRPDSDPALGAWNPNQLMKDLGITDGMTKLSEETGVKDANSELNQKLQDLGNKLGVGTPARRADSGLWGSGTALSKYGSIPTKTETTATSDAESRNAVAESLTALRRLSVNSDEKQQDSVASVPAPASRAVTMQVQPGADTSDSPAQVTKVQHGVDSFERAATEKVAKTFTGSKSTEAPESTPPSSTGTRNPETSAAFGAPDRTLSGGGSDDATETPSQQVRSGISKVTGGLSGGAKARNTDDNKAGGLGGGQPDKAGTHGGRSAGSSGGDSGKAAGSNGSSSKSGSSSTTDAGSKAGSSSSSSKSSSGAGKAGSKSGSSGAGGSSSGGGKHRAK